MQPRHTLRRLAGAAALAAALAAPAAPAHAALTAVSDETSPANGLPSWYEDGTGLQLQQCVDGTELCLGGTATPPESVTDHEVLYWSATAEAGPVSLVLALEGVTNVAEPDQPAEPGVLNAVRIDINGGVPNSTYTVTHPFGVARLTTDAGGRARLVEENLDPAEFGDALTGAVGPFLRWDPAVAPAAPGGHVGDPEIPHTVVGSPFDTNYLRVEGPGTAVQTDEFGVLGQVVDQQDPPASAFTGWSPKSLGFGSQQIGTTSDTRSVTITNRGDAPLTFGGAVLGGADAGRFAIASNDCGTAIAALGGSCSIGVTFAPVATGAHAATLNITDGGPGSPRSVPLDGTGAAVPTAPPSGGEGTTPAGGSTPGSTAPGGQVVGQRQPAARRALRVSGLNVSRRIRSRSARRRGIGATMKLPEGTGALRVRLSRVGGRRPLVDETRRGLNAGTYTLRLRSRGLRRQLRPGLYRLEVTPVDAGGALGRPAARTIRVTR